MTLSKIIQKISKKAILAYLPIWFSFNENFNYMNGSIFILYLTEAGLWSEFLRRKVRWGGKSLSYGQKRLE